MRNLTVIRRKTFVASLNKVKIYMEDPNGETVINGVKCTYVASLKNNSKATFTIPNESVKIFAIYDKISKGYCSDCYIVPEGETDYFISGVSKFDPTSGNPFYFDGVTDSEILAKRKQGSKTGLIIFIVAIVVGIVAGVAVSFVIYH